MVINSGKTPSVTACERRGQRTYLKNSLERTTLEVRKYQTGFLGVLGLLVGRCVFPLAGCNLGNAALDGEDN